jgi:NAD(P)-dependent dehydrogenase (short-subunit alcohol dehydrogenase family)
MKSLANNVVVVTGSSRGFGYALANEFLRSGARVVISSRDADAVSSAVSDLGHPEAALGVPCDVRELRQVRGLAAAAVERFGRIDLWINNAGLAHAYVKMLEIDPAQWRASFETNLLGSYHGCLVALNDMLPRRSGQIINILGFGVDRPSPNQSAYGASKSALWQLTRTLAQEYAGAGICINAVMPGMIWTEMLTRAEGVNDPRLRTRMEWAMRVFGNPPEVPARFVVGVAARNGESGRMFRLITPRVFLPRMIGEFFGAGRRNPRPWQK